MEIIDGYPDFMMESIKKVERTRKSRIGRNLPRMSSDQREVILSKFHPDYKEHEKKKLQIGPNKGYRMPLEMISLLEAEPFLDTSKVDLSRVDYDVDVLIIGGGGGGTVASIWANMSGVPADRILISTKLRHGDSNSMMAQGGIQAADGPIDNPPIHYLDIIGGGHFANKPKLARILAMQAPKIIKWHESLGVMYDKDKEGNFVERPGGGTSRKRMHSSKDYTGMEILRVVRDESINRKIPVLEFSPAIELLKDDMGQVAGAILMNLETNQYYIVKAKVVIMATGGWGRLHIQNFATTNHYGATADGLVMAYHVGAKLRDLDSVQYHPTGAAYPEQIVGLLITEKVRTMGAQPVNMNGELFVNPLEPRDVEASAFIRECYEREMGITTPTGMTGVWLDSPMIDIVQGEGTIHANLDAMYRMFQRFGIDMTKHPMLVFPTLHYQNGGVEINEHCQTSVKGLFAAGEVTGGVHGKNRLMGNSLLDYNVFGKIAGINVAEYIKNVKIGKLTLDHVDKYRNILRDANIKSKVKAPMILPEYREENLMKRTIKV
ncbi:MAG: FAD-binding protein [Candidatus Eremiobacteraeota bacterium]|nr:FAD-binding protein [Candidatus Eremiobacteraeota bacterium]